MRGGWRRRPARRTAAWPAAPPRPDHAVRGGARGAPPRGSQAPANAPPRPLAPNPLPPTFHSHAPTPVSSLLSSDARAALGLDPEGSALVFDEAHNLLDAINGAHGCSVTGVQARTRTRARGPRKRLAGSL